MALACVHPIRSGLNTESALHSHSHSLSPSSTRALSLPSSLLSTHSSRVLSHRQTPSPNPQARGVEYRAGRPGSCRALFGLGLPELLVIGGVAVVLFGPKQLPEIGKSLGKTVKGFQEAAKEFQTELKEAAKGDSESEDASQTPQATQIGVTPSPTPSPTQKPVEGIKSDSK